MATPITEPKLTGKSSISVRSEQVDSANATPFAPVSAPENGLSSILTPPRGPDGKNLILDDNGTSWRPIQTEPQYSSELINDITDGGKNTSDVLTRGLDAVVADRLNTPRTLQNIAPQLLNDSIDSDVPNTFTSDTKLIGQQLWQYAVTLFNHKQDIYKVPTHAIKILCIEDDILSWPLRGYIIIDNRMEGFEKSEDFKHFYFLRSDARDEIKIEWKPVIAKGILPDKIWKIDLEAVIYDIEDLPHADMSYKSKKLYFWDKKFQHLLEKNIQWSTSTGKRFVSSPCPAPIAHASDTDRAMYTGEAIASLLSTAGYESYINQDKWNWGKGKILFTAKAEWTIWECIQYILEQQISDDGENDICLLQWNRGDKQWTLEPMWSLFKQAGETSPGKLQVEHMFFEENTGDDKTYISTMKAPIDLMDPSYEVDIKADDFNKITNYRFSQTSGLDSAKAFLSRPVYSHWHKKKQFDVDAKENEIKYVKDYYFKGKYVKYLLSPDKYPVMALNKSKTDQLSISPGFSPISTLDPKNDRGMRSMGGKGKILYAGLFLNQSMILRMIGSTHRLSGTFIGVDRIKNPSDTVYDHQICGQYFVTNIKHIIQQQKYVNDVTMIKIHAYKALPVDEGVS